MAGRVSLQAAATTGNGNEWDCKGIPGTYQLEVVGAGATITGGELQWEQAQSSGYAGTWAPLAAPIAPLVGVLSTQVFVGAPRFVRCRVASTITGTTSPSVTAKMRVPLEMNT